MEKTWCTTLPGELSRATLSLAYELESHMESMEGSLMLVILNSLDNHEILPEEDWSVTVAPTQRMIRYLGELHHMEGVGTTPLEKQSVRRR